MIFNFAITCASCMQDVMLMGNFVCELRVFRLKNYNDVKFYRYELRL